MDGSLALFGLLLGFTFAMALGKHDNRRLLVIADTNSVGDLGPLKKGTGSAPNYLSCGAKPSRAVPVPFFNGLLALQRYVARGIRWPRGGKPVETG